MPGKIFKDGFNAPRLNDTVRQYPRTLEEAFGPHCRKQIGDAPRMDWQDKLVLWACVATVVVVVALSILGRV